MYSLRTSLLSACLLLVLPMLLAPAAAMPSESRGYLATGTEILGLATGQHGEPIRFDGGPSLKVEDVVTDNVPLEVCAHGDDQTRCHGLRCGRVFSLGADFPVRHTTVRIVALHVTSDVEVCQATAGTVTATW